MDTTSIASLLRSLPGSSWVNRIVSGNPNDLFAEVLSHCQGNRPTPPQDPLRGSGVQRKAVATPRHEDKPKPQSEELADDHDTPNMCIASEVKHAAEKYGVPEKMINAVIFTESAGKCNAVSPVGAQGLMQLMPATAKDLGVTNPFDPHQNIDAGTRYLKQLHDRYDGNWEKALAAYNAGMGRVDRHGGIPPIRETINYVKKVLGKFFSA